MIDLDPSNVSKLREYWTGPLDRAKLFLFDGAYVDGSSNAHPRSGLREEILMYGKHNVSLQKDLNIRPTI